MWRCAAAAAAAAAPPGWLGVYGAGRFAGGGGTGRGADCARRHTEAMSAQSRIGLFCTAGLSLRARKFPCVRSGRWMGSRGAVC
jgi:hypothetical protein